MEGRKGHNSVLLFQLYFKYLYIGIHFLLLLLFLFYFSNFTAVILDSSFIIIEPCHETICLYHM